MTGELEDYLKRLLETKDINDLPIDEALLKTAHLIDLSSDFSNLEGTQLALQWCDLLEKSDMTPGQRSQLQYYRSNAWDEVRKRNYTAGDYESAWEQPELRHQLLSLRRAVNRDGLAELQPSERAQILTNLANTLHSAGRTVEAGEYWGRAIAECPGFAIALGNRGTGWFKYASAYYDPGQQDVFLYRAHQSLSVALAPGANWDIAPDGARDHFTAYHEHIGKMIDVEQFGKAQKLDGFGLGRARRERAYRQWALDNTLFLNPLNDLSNSDIAAQDALSLPSYKTPLDEGPTLIGFFNQMKQEFASARWLLFEGITNDAPHFSDKGTGLRDTLDSPGYSLSVEQTKLAFRAAYSLLDKIAFFLNDYLKLQIPLIDVSFRSLWFVKRGSTELRPAFTQARNWPLRGLYWLAKDFIEKDFQASTETDARDMATIRNHLEHKYLKIHDRDPFYLAYPSAYGDPYDDRLAFSIERHDFEAKALRILKLARAAMIYLCLAMHRKETSEPQDETKLTMPRTLPSWKRRPRY
ncbi:hypothetical protein EJ076_29560 [Mesorhizobium sp. M7D.F.Ca.US.005.01.1.1]|uniref:LA2681 family HEPN domain-containing protein n=1 Tax=Mesorhizobium sp. M7D.F.Ca.US.005.01.1.1 TaxID=2493678 RepID=UPI000F75EBFA|nr:LA2681 family HEPN domain-containing protein [Mesorhizobium sp. M7D.F.Ca.US.005.01.1.1]AZO44955.1 hypothetical protein EJ076_29560 [Mesorhizobium sp. M7D.F.Ca.US.005.01.1.1]